MPPEASLLLVDLADDSALESPEVAELLVLPCPGPPPPESL